MIPLECRRPYTCCLDRFREDWLSLPARLDRLRHVPGGGFSLRMPFLPVQRFRKWNPREQDVSVVPDLNMPVRAVLTVPLAVNPDVSGCLEGLVSGLVQAGKIDTFRLDNHLVVGVREKVQGHRRADRQRCWSTDLREQRSTSRVGKASRTLGSEFLRLVGMQRAVLVSLR
jgi:hypothetical protein